MTEDRDKAGSNYKTFNSHEGSVSTGGSDGTRTYTVDDANEAIGFGKFQWFISFAAGLVQACKYFSKSFVAGSFFVIKLP